MTTGQSPELLAACKAALLYHQIGAGWVEGDAARWLALTGRRDVTAAVLCDLIRAAIARATGE
jgi:hypothetical protein